MSNTSTATGPDESTVHCDVLVLGGGGAGLAAGVAAAESGSRVVVLEKGPTVGGSTAMATGAINAPMTIVQRNAGVSDSADQFISDMVRTGGPLEERENVELRRLYALNAGKTVDWLVGFGVRFVGPFPEAAHSQPRTHLVAPSAKSYAAVLSAAARRYSVRIETTSPVDTLLRDDTGRVIGATSGDTTYLARRGVIIATGDHSASPGLFGAEGSASATPVQPINTLNTGDGILLGQSVGGRVVKLDTTVENFRYQRHVDPLKLLPSGRLFARLAGPVANRLPRRLFDFIATMTMASTIAPSPDLYHAGAIHISPSGRRVANEESALELVRGVATNGDRSYLIFDADIADRFRRGGRPVTAFPGVTQVFLDDVRRFRPDVVAEAPTIEGLAAELGIPEEDLVRTFTEWNDAVASGADQAFGRSSLGAGLHRGPFYAIGPLRGAVTLTNSGLAVDSGLRVLDSAGKAIPGLYAAGSAGQGGMLLLANGLHIGWAMTSGRLAGTAAARAPITGS